MFRLKLSKEEKDAVIREIQTYFQVEHGIEFGMIAAEQIMEAQMQTLGPILYNYAVQDCRKVIQEKMLALEDELYTLEKPKTR
ncbi:DUF2164 domain-containing protein [Marinicrinis lubricantis]|uniref:DUF2164 domain-containing protein n=1 Tax=Marinicrinis lubricantis TaxID=2086470 RepID=A0ABW1IL51_9BACL